MSSILDSNITTLLLGIILYIFGSGPVQGFATTLIIGILTSLFSAIFITRMIFETWIDKGKKINFWTSSTENAFKHININWVGNRKKYYLFSGILITAGIISAFTKGFNYGVSFEGGRSYTIQFSKPIANNEIRDGLTSYFDNEAPEVKTFGVDNQKKITTTYLINSQDLKSDSVAEQKLKEGLEKMSPGSYKIVRQQKVGPTSFTLLKGIVPFALEIDEDFIAAILTVMGYSMTDTVVVFDRIREYLTHHKKKELEGAEKTTVINSALNNTLSRTLITSLTIFMVLLAIFIFGGETIRGFSFSLLIGIVIGTYSSICIATPVVVDFDKEK
ncbi:MAG: hypothetical protein HYZ42_08725 [Bacteroidetes bacterium]|nr:hypothetical protein [Bacteroidota bacterium]